MCWVSHSILWLCRNSVAAVAKEESRSNFNYEGGKLILAVQSALRDWVHHGNFPLYQWKNSAQHNIIACQVGNCYQGTPWVCRIHNVSFHFLSLHNSHKQLSKVMTTTSTKQSYSYHPERHTGRLQTTRYFTPPLAFSIHYVVISIHYINISAYSPWNVNWVTHAWGACRLRVKVMFQPKG